MLMAMKTCRYISQKPQSKGNMHVILMSSRFIAPLTDSQDESDITGPKTTYVHGNSQD